MSCWNASALWLCTSRLVGKGVKVRIGVLTGIVVVVSIVIIDVDTGTGISVVGRSGIVSAVLPNLKIKELVVL